MRVSLALLPLLGAALAIPIQSQPVTKVAHADFLGLPDLGGIFGSLPKLHVSEVVAELNTTLGGTLPPIPAEVLDKIQGILDTISGGAGAGNQLVNADFKAEEFGPFSHHELPPWLLDLVQKLIEFLTGLSAGNPPIGIPTGIPTSVPIPTDLPFPPGLPTDVPIPTGLPTDVPIPTDIPTDVPTPTGIPTDLPFPPTEPEPTDIPTGASTALPIPTGLPTDTGLPIPSDTEVPSPSDTEVPTPSDTELPVPSGSTDGPIPTDMPASSDEPVPTDLPTEPASTGIPTNSTVSPVPTATTSTLPGGSSTSQVSISGAGSMTVKPFPGPGSN